MAPLAPALGIDEFVEFAGRDARMSDRWHSVEFLSVNPGGTPRKNTCLTDTLTTCLTEWLTLRRNLANLADVRLIHAHAAAEAPRYVRRADLDRRESAAKVSGPWRRLAYQITRPVVTSRVELELELRDEGPALAGALVGPTDRGRRVATASHRPTGVQQANPRRAESRDVTSRAPNGRRTYPASAATSDVSHLTATDDQGRRSTSRSIMPLTDHVQRFALASPATTTPIRVGPTGLKGIREGQVLPLEVRRRGSRDWYSSTHPLCRWRRQRLARWCAAGAGPGDVPQPTAPGLPCRPDV